MNFFISEAHANAGAAGPSAMGQIVMLLGFVLIFIFCYGAHKQNVKRAAYTD